MSRVGIWDYFGAFVALQEDEGWGAILGESVCIPAKVAM